VKNNENLRVRERMKGFLGMYGEFLGTGCKDSGKIRIPISSGWWSLVRQGV
jgi:hypothetical protein